MYTIKSKAYNPGFNAKKEYFEWRMVRIDIIVLTWKYVAIIRVDNGRIYLPKSRKLLDYLKVFHWCSISSHISERGSIDGDITPSKIWSALKGSLEGFLSLGKHYPV